jgi:hypothetical protein
MLQDDKGVRFDLTHQDAWDPLDTVIKVSVQPGYGLLSRGNKATMSGEIETPGWALKNATDGNKNTGWSSEVAKPGERGSNEQHRKSGRDDIGLGAALDPGS